MPLVTFVYYTVIVFTPLLTAAFFSVYLTNIPGLFQLEKDVNGQDDIDNYGLKLNVPALEIGLFVTGLIFFILLIPSRHILKLQRDEFRISLFKKLTDKKSTFLYQIMFYVLKRIHIFLLFLVFVFGMQEINLYYIGLMFFFVIFASSLNTYRKSGKILVLYAAFFIWIQYLWSLI
jgi:hypothetical protein